MPKVERKTSRIRTARRNKAKLIHHVDYYKYADHTDQYYNPNEKKIHIRHPFNMLIAGKTGSGKTQFLLDVIRLCRCFHRVKVFCRHPDEPLYRYLKKKYDAKVRVTNDMQKLPPVDEMRGKNNSQTLMVFDDVIGMGRTIQQRILEYFISARKSNCSCAYISQNYFSTPKPIRTQMTYIALMKGITNNDLALISREYSGDKGELESLYHVAMTPKQQTTKKKMMDFLLVSPQEERERMYRMSFTNYI